MKLIIIILLSAQAFAQDISFKTLNCFSLNDEAKIKVNFPRPIKASIPFTRFPEMYGSLQLDHPKLNQTYIRDNIVFIPETHPPGPIMRGQSSDAVYIRLEPIFLDTIFSGTYWGQLFINDKDRPYRGTYFRYMGDSEAPGIICNPLYE